MFNDNLYENIINVESKVRVPDLSICSFTLKSTDIPSPFKLEKLLTWLSEKRVARVVGISRFVCFFCLKKNYLLSTLNSMDLTSYQGWKKERIVQDFLDGSRIIIVMPDEKQCMKKVTI